MAPTSSLTNVSWAFCAVLGLRTSLSTPRQIECTDRSRCALFITMVLEMTVQSMSGTSSLHSDAAAAVFFFFASTTTAAAADAAAAATAGVAIASATTAAATMTIFDHFINTAPMESAAANFGPRLLARGSINARC